jgi:hypothetical protein
MWSFILNLILEMVDSPRRFYTFSVIFWIFGRVQGVSKRCRLSWLTNSALAKKPRMRGDMGGGGGGCGSQPMSTAVHMEHKMTLEI